MGSGNWISKPVQLITPVMTRTGAVERLRKYARGRGRTFCAGTISLHSISSQVIPMSSVPNQICWREHKNAGALKASRVRIYAWSFMVLNLSAHFLVRPDVGWPVWGADALLAVKAHQVFLIPSHSSAQVLSNTSAARDNYQANSPGFSSTYWFREGWNQPVVDCLALTGDQVPIHIVVSHHHCRMLSAVIQFCSLKYLQNLNKKYYI
jgi:hypothetical protein